MAFVDSLGYQIISGQKQSTLAKDILSKVAPNKSAELDKAIGKIQKGQDTLYKAGIAIGATALGVSAIKKAKIAANAKSNVSASGEETALGSLDNKPDKTIQTMLNEKAAKLAQIQEVTGGTGLMGAMTLPETPKNNNTIYYIGGAILLYLITKK